MSAAVVARRWLEILQSDAEVVAHAQGFQARCLHCRRRHLFAPNGTPVSPATIEHIVPQSWFGKHAALKLTQMLSGPNDLRNLGIACAGCNHSKGRGLDARGPTDTRAREVVEAMQAQRTLRFRRRTHERRDADSGAVGGVS